MDVIGSILYIALVAFMTLAVAGFLPRRNPFLLRLRDECRNRLYKRRWLRLMAWEHQHPLGQPREP